MKHLCARLLVIAALGSLLASAGCVLNNSDLVITDNVCVNLQEVQTTGTFSSFTVCDKFRDQLEKKLAAYGKSKKDVKSIHMVGATFKAVSVKPHDWMVTADIDIARQDTPGGAYDDGPAPFVSFDNQSLKGLTGAPNQADMHADGVTLVNDALAALVAGGDPRLVLIVNNESVTPTPSESDPMEFRVETCVRFQAVIGKNK
jgi:hypothetical protein